MCNTVLLKLVFDIHFMILVLPLKVNYFHVEISFDKTVKKKRKQEKISYGELSNFPKTIVLF